MTNDKRNVKRHDSYGMLQISRLHGGATHLFGSNIPHQNTIRLSIHRGTHERDLHHDWYYADNAPIIEVEMSQSQFAEAITSLNMGDGTPVTITRHNGKFIEKPDFENKRMLFEEEFKEKLETMTAQLDTFTEETEDLLKNKKSINKGDRVKILNTIQKFKSEIASNIPFLTASYNEQLDKTTHEAKSELEAFTINKINQLGIQGLHELNEISSSANKQLDKE